MKSPDQLAKAQIQRRITGIRECMPFMNVRGGWVRFMRQSLGITLKKLGERADLTLSSVHSAERNEAAGTVSIKTLRLMAEAMNCEFVYAFVPRTGLDEIQKQAAREKAKRLLSTADTHMLLEDQRVTQNLEERIEQLAEALVKKGDVW